MANSKSIKITGDVPFNIYEYEDAQPMWAFFSSPVGGLSISYNGLSRHEPNEYGGKTSFYSFTMKGTEAVSYGWLDKFVEIVKKYGGKITSKKVVDLDANGRRMS